ncbi:MAG: ribbon-helix-helix domain-containing protein [Cyanobacteriota bacterium]
MRQIICKTRLIRCLDRSVPDQLQKFSFGDPPLVPPSKTSALAFRKPRRVTITLPHATYLELERRCSEQGRSLSNLSAYLFECAVSQPHLESPLSIASISRAIPESRLDL